MLLSSFLTSCGGEFTLHDGEGLFDPNDPKSVELARDMAQDWLSARGGSAVAGVDELASRAVDIDTLGMAHVRFDQKQKGLPVFGAQAVVHMTPDGSVSQMTDGLVRELDVDTEPDLAKRDAIDLARGEYEGPVDSADADLMLMRHEGKDHLVYQVRIQDFASAEPAMPVIFIDAHTGKIVWEYDNLQTAKNRRTYSANNGTSLPGSLRRSEGQGATGDVPVDDAHDHAGITYDYYWTQQGRDSYDGAGAALTSTAHYSNLYDNAFWNGSQMVYGDGGTYFYPLSGSLDVVAHELTHAVTERTAGLVYSGESGGLNEAASDIMGVTIDSYSRGWTIDANTWKLGEDITKPALGDALRYMDNPPADGVSIDNYANYYNGLDVHYSSGIANKWFYLTVSDPSVSMAQAANIWYRALTLYMTPSTTFAQARTATESAATDLYGASSPQLAAVRNAWNGVGVVSFDVFSTVAGLSGAASSTQNFQFNTPTGATAVQFAMSGGTGDADMYVRFGSAPTTTTYDCRPYLNGNNETCTFSPAQSGTYYVMIRGYSAYSGVTLTALQAGGTGGGGGSPEVCNDGIDNDLDGAIDCADSNCASDPSCSAPTPEVCNDGVDNDGDGATDCADSDCAGDASCSSNCPGGEYTGTLSSSNTNAYFEYTTSGTGLFEATLTGDSGTDFDLYLQYRSGSRWRNRASSTGSTSTESVSYTEGSNVVHRWRVNRWSGTGNFTLCIQSPN